MTGRMERRLARPEAAQGGRQGVHVFPVPRELEGEVLARRKAQAMAGILKATTVVMVQMRDAEVTR